MEATKQGLGFRFQGLGSKLTQVQRRRGLRYLVEVQPSQE